MGEDTKNATLDELRKGSEALFKKIYQNNRKKFLNFAKKYGLAEEENIDIYQDAYIVFYENIIKGKITNLTSSASTYIFGIGKNMILDRLRKNRKTVSSESIPLLVKDQGVYVDEISWEDNPLTPEQESLRKFFKELGEKCQKILKLFYYQGYTIEEIKIEGGYSSENVVKSHKSRCLKTLREHMNSNSVI